jgi:phosphopantothenoylcysteine decarboxylase/phosphopantothenate--cysteine ligase
MGIALAKASAKRGWITTLLLGPTALAPPEDSHVRTVRFQTTADLQNLLRSLWPEHDVLLMAAAVADFRPVRTDVPKLRRKDQRLALELEPTPDLLAELAASKRVDQTIIGFALEPAERLLDSARQKLHAKGVDAIVANPLETMDSPSVTATVLFADGRSATSQPGMPKAAFAQWLLETLGATFSFQVGAKSPASRR